MWYISRLSFCTTGELYTGQIVPVKYYYFTAGDARTMHLVLSLRDTVTGKVVEIAEKNWYTFLRLMDEYKPYGRVAGGYTKCDAMYVQVDELSIRFLDYVDEVVLVSKSSIVKSQDFFKGLHSCFSFWDKEKSLVNCSSSFVNIGFPLFQIMCFYSAGWGGEDYFLCGRTGEIVKVKFTDVRRARAMIAKAVCSGYNPVQDSKNDLPHLQRMGVKFA